MAKTSDIIKKPKTARDYFLLGNLYLEQGLFSKAEDAYKKASAKGFRNAKLYNNLGITQKSLNKTDEAERCFKRAIKHDPNLHQAYNNFGNILISKNKMEKAIENYEKAIKINPYFSNAYNNLGTTWQKLGHISKAVKYYQKALSLEPKYPDALNNLASAYKNQNKLSLAIKTFKKAIKILPDFIEAHYNLASCYQEKGDHEKAIKYARKALEIYPEYQDSLHLLLQEYKTTCNWPGYKREVTKLNRMTEPAIRNKYRPGETPFFSVTNFEDPVRNLWVAKLWCNFTASHLPEKKPKFKFTNIKPQKKLKIGYLSYEFRDHVIGNQSISLFKNHNRNKFKIYAYSYGPNDKSFNRKFVEKYADKFIDLSKISYLDSAKQIYKDGIDILVDLNGHTKGSRLEICALKPAPVQITYLGFTGSTGADFFDYAIVDKQIVPPKDASLYTENLIYLPQYLVNSYSELGKIRKTSRKAQGLPEKSIVFCSFNNSYKLTQIMFKNWMEIIKSVPNSILWLLDDNKIAKQNLTKEVEKAKVNPKRIIFAKRTDYKKHLSRLSLADIFLDTFPYNGGATTSNALWAGVPVVSMYGKTYVSRMGKSILSAVGIPELAVNSYRKYKKTAIDLGNNPQKLKEYKRKLADNRKNGNFFNSKYFVSKLETAYEKVWEYRTKNKLKEIIEIKE